MQTLRYGVAGTESDFSDFGGPIMGDMLRAQESYSPDAKRRRSGRLVPADGPTITSSGNICAATRATAFSGHRPQSTDRRAFGAPGACESLVEANRQSFGGHSHGGNSGDRKV